VRLPADGAPVTSIIRSRTPRDSSECLVAPSPIGTASWWCHRRRVLSEAGVGSRYSSSPLCQRIGIRTAVKAEPVSGSGDSLGR